MPRLKDYWVVNVRTSAQSVATLAQIGHSGDWEEEQSGNLNGSAQQAHTSTNWYYPFL